MRIHLQNPDNDPLFDFTRAMWDAAATQAPDIGAGHVVSIGVTPADFVAAMRDAEALVTDASVIKALFPCPAPQPEADFPDQRGPRPAGAVQLVAAGGRVAEQPRHPRGEVRRVRHHVDPDAGQPASRHGDQPAAGRVAQGVGIGPGWP